MKLVTYKYNDKTQLTTHFKATEWRCKCGKTHDTVIADTLPPLLESLMTKIGAVRGDLSSGYRCPAHDKAIGASGKGPHTQGYACDIKFTDKNGKVIPSKTVALALEDMGHKCGIGYRCGGSDNYTHIDVKPRKWYGDEKKSMTASIGSSFYTYFGMVKPTTPSTPTTTLTKTLTTAVYGRPNAGFAYKKTLYKKGTVVTNCTMNVATANGYKWFVGYVNNTKVYFPYNAKWYK